MARFGDPTRNQVQIAGANSGSDPKIDVIGASDANIDFDLQSKGSGVVRLNSRTYTNTTGDTIGFASKSAQGATTTGEIYGAQLSPRANAGFGAASLIGASFDPILKQTGNLAGNITNLRGVQITFTDENLGSSTRTITNTAMIRLWHQLDASHTITNGIVGIDWEAAGARAWAFAMKFADDGGAGLADLASAVATVNGVIKVKIGSTTCYIPTYASYTPT